MIYISKMGVCCDDAQQSTGTSRKNSSKVHKMKKKIDRSIIRVHGVEPTTESEAGDQAVCNTDQLSEDGDTVAELGEGEGLTRTPTASLEVLNGGNLVS